MSRPRATGAVGALVALCGWVSPARADLRDQAERLAEAWKAVGAAVVVDRSRFLEEDEPDRDRRVMVVLPPLPEGECTTVALLGTRGLGFHVRVAELSGDEPSIKRVPSVAGVAVLESCGQPRPEKVVVASDSGRGAFETIVARSARPLPPLRSVLPERTAGILPVSLEPGPLPALPPPDKRADYAEARARRDGAAVLARTTWTAGADRAGAGQLALDPGCHTVTLFAVDPRSSRPTARGRLDLDAEMRDEDGERVLARDRSDAPDATLVECVGESTPVQVAFAGAPAGSEVLASHVSWPLPDHMPKLWGPSARGRLARVLRARHVAALPAEAVLLAQGGYGLTPVPLEVLPGACYLAVVTLAHEEARSLGLRVRIGAFDAGDDRGIDDDGAAVAFCAGDRARAMASVEARGTPMLGWGLALFKLGTGLWEVAR